MTVNLAAMIAEALMAAEQGVKSIVPLVHFMGNMAQDLAMVRAAASSDEGIPRQVRIH